MVGDNLNDVEMLDFAGTAVGDGNDGRPQGAGISPDRHQRRSGARGGHPAPRIPGLTRNLRPVSASAVAPPPAFFG
jgi:hypothetical protein